MGGLIVYRWKFQRFRCVSITVHERIGSRFRDWVWRVMEKGEMGVGLAGGQWEVGWWGWGWGWGYGIEIRCVKAWGFGDWLWGGAMGRGGDWDLGGRGGVGLLIIYLFLRVLGF